MQTAKVIDLQSHPKFVERQQEREYVSQVVERITKTQMEMEALTAKMSTQSESLGVLADQIDTLCTKMDAQAIQKRLIEGDPAVFCAHMVIVDGICCTCRRHR